jgi:hypothetical protein
MMSIKTLPSPDIVADVFENPSLGKVFFDRTSGLTVLSAEG